VTETALAGMPTSPQVIVAANDDMALGAMEAVKGRNLKGIVIIGFDALPEALAQVRDGGLAALDRGVPRQAMLASRPDFWRLTSSPGRSQSSR